MVSYRERINQDPIERSIMLNEQINKLNQDILDNPEYYDRKVWRETRINPKEIVYTCRDPRCKAEPTEGDRHSILMKI